ncbi:unnamed protein product [Candida verbasci]|uniref:Uncharacterized protein n=1 Tax=Candida verbasci TaxID=1227364 RepID=A0A9W4XCH2_9ASCO|nr:unnamed protein product [Candida verbasci]
MIAYSKFNEVLSSDVNLITCNEKGQLFRNNIIDEIDFSKAIDDFPFLPFKELKDAKWVLAESSAIWAHVLSQNPNFINQQLVTSYLNIASNIGDLEDFKDRYQNTTFLNEKDAPTNRNFQVFNETKAADKDYYIASPSNSNLVTKSPILSSLINSLENQNLKVSRDTIIYIVCLKAARKSKNLDFINQIIYERGIYRKSEDFSNLSTNSQKELDFSFASALCETYSTLNMLDDAMSIVLSTENRFSWTFKQLKHLKIKAENIEDNHIINEINRILKS